MKKVTSFAGGVLLAASILFSGAAQAKLTTFHYDATINDFGDNAAFGALYPIGGVVHGSFVLDDGRPNSQSDPSGAYFVDALVSSNSTVGNVQVSTNRGSIAVQHRAGEYDTISMISGQLFGDGGAVYANQSVPGLQLTGWNLMLMGGGGNILQSHAFPSTNQITNVSAFDTHTLYLIYQKPDGALYVTANVSNIQAIPEPESYAMLMAGLGIMGMMARRKQKSAQQK